MEGVSEAWCWRDCHSDSSQSHTFLVLHERDWLVSALGYLHKGTWLADDCVGAWNIEKFSTSATCNASEAMDSQFNSATLDFTPFKVNESLVNGALHAVSQKYQNVLAALDLPYSFHITAIHSVDIVGYSLPGSGNMRCTNSNICIVLFWNSVVNIT